MKNVNVSVFPNCMTRKPKGTDKLLDCVITSIFKEEVEKIRAIEDKEERRELKIQLPCFTPSGQFSIRKKDGLIQHSGYISIDIDKADNPHIKDFEQLRRDLGTIENVACASLSVSGKGVFALIPIKHPEKHKEHFEALVQDFQKLGIILDKGCGDVTRLRVISYDPNVYINEDAKVYTKIYERPRKVQRAMKISTKNKNNENKVEKKVQEIIETINHNGVDITGDYNQWFKIGCSLANEFGEEGREMFHEISAWSEKYDESKTDIQYNQCLANNYSYTIGTFFHYAAEEGIK